MCGLFGVYTTYSHLGKPEIEGVTELGHISSLRGTDSTGIATASTGKKGKVEYRYRKAARNSAVFMWEKPTQDDIKEKFLVMGHARAATYGAVNTDNAHPYVEGHIVGCHNGSIWSFAPAKVDEDKTTDSRELFRYMRNNGLLVTLRRAYHGAYALTWMDTKQNTLNFVRNSDRELWMMRAKSGNVLYWASEERFLNLVEHGSGTHFEKPELLPTHMHATCKLSATTIKMELVNIAEKIRPPVGRPVVVLPNPASDLPSHKNGLPNVYCVACRYNIQLCDCKSGSTFTQPMPFQISSDGRKYCPDGWDLSVGTGPPKPEDKGKTTSVPVVEKPTLPRKCTLCRELLMKCKCSYSSYPEQSVFRKDEPHYLGYRREEMTTQEARKRLSTGCSHCTVVKDLKDSVMFYDYEGYVCSDNCYALWAKEGIFKGESTYEGKLVNGDKYVERKHH